MAPPDHQSEGNHESGSHVIGQKNQKREYNSSGQHEEQPREPPQPTFVASGPVAHGGNHDVAGAEATRGCDRGESGNNGKISPDLEEMAHLGEIDATDVGVDGSPTKTLSGGRSGSPSLVNVSSPPPASVHSAQLTSLSPPPISSKPSGSGGLSIHATNTTSSQSMVGRVAPGAIHSSTGIAQPGPIAGVTSANGGSVQPESGRRPPLPPRGVATHLSSGDSSAAGHLPPQQIGTIPLRMDSTEDASFLSNLTDPDSTREADENLHDDGTTGDTKAGTSANTRGGAAAIGAFSAASPPQSSARRRKLGVSWDFGARMSHADRHGHGPPLSHEPTLRNEQAEFESAGILQPILVDDDKNEAPKRSLTTNSSDVEEDESSKRSRNFSIDSHTAPPPPPPPEPVVAKHRPVNSVRSGKSLWDKISIATMATSKMKETSQFGDEADLAILEALSTHNMHPNGENSYRRLGNEHDVEDRKPLFHGKGDQGEFKMKDIPSHVGSGHHKSVSSLTNFHIQGLEAEGRSESKFEDPAWNDEYDARGRIDGSLREERDVQLAEEVFGADIGIPALGGDETASYRSGLRLPDQAEKASVGDAHTDKSSTNIIFKTEVAPKTKPGGISIQKERPEKKTEFNELRHRRNYTFKDMANELHQMASIDNANGQQGRRAKTNTVQGNDRNGVENFLVGADILYRQNSDSDDTDSPHVEENKGNVKMRRTASFPQLSKASVDNQGNLDENAHDEETGDAHTPNKDTREPTSRFTRTPTKSTPRTNVQRRSAMLYHLHVWYYDLIRPKIPAFTRNATHAIIFVFAPLVLTAVVLYYGAGNPIAGSETIDGGLETVVIEPASWSWWVLFFARQFFLLSCTKAGEVFWIDIMALRTPIFIKTIGSFATLMIVQARGWPYVVTFWAVLDFCFLFGNHRFAKQWLFWQDWIGLFNGNNPSGNFLFTDFYMRLLLAMMSVGIFTALKRLWVATFLGKRSFAHYGPELEVILAKMLLVSQVAHIARQIEAQVITSRVNDGFVYTMQSKDLHFPGIASESEDETPMQQARKTLGGPTSNNNTPTESQKESPKESPGEGFGKSLLDAGIGSKFVKDASRPRLDDSKSLKDIGSSSRLEIMHMLEEWEEPEIKANSASKATIRDILQFRQAVSLMDDKYPFTPAFGPAKTRAACVDSSEELFNRLLQESPNSSLLPFETLSRVAYDGKGDLMRDKVKALIRLFRPDRKGYLTKLDFVSSIDSVYKDLRLFRASLANSSQIDDSFESIVNLIHYIFLAFIFLVIIGFQVWESLISFAAFFFSFSFMFGPASSKYFEGILLIFVRRPYDIGDKIALSDPSVDTKKSGSSTWFVEKVSLFTTTVRFSITNEVATYSNGSLARLRIINAKRSPKAIVYVFLKFGSDVPYQMIQVFETAIEKFVKSRPREWVAMNGFRATRVEMELNFIEYVIVVTHREMWQNVGPILQSQADLASFSLEVSKKLNLRYSSPPKPVHLSVSDSEAKRKNRTLSDGESIQMTGASKLQEVANLFGKDR